MFTLFVVSKIYFGKIESLLFCKTIFIDSLQNKVICHEDIFSVKNEKNQSSSKLLKMAEKSAKCTFVDPPPNFLFYHFFLSLKKTKENKIKIVINDGKMLSFRHQFSKRTILCIFICLFFFFCPLNLCTSPLTAPTSAITLKIQKQIIFLFLCFLN